MIQRKSMNIKFAKKFAKSYNKAPTKIKKAFNDRLELFQENPFNPLLNNHQLTGKYEGLRSINITGNWRGIFQKLDNNLAYFVELGTHSQLYK